MSGPADGPRVLLTLAVSGHFGSVYAFGTARGWLEISVTPTGFVRVSEWRKGSHPYFTPR